MPEFAINILSRFRSLRGAVVKYPLSILFAAAFTLTTWVEIYIGWPRLDQHQYLLSVLHWTFAWGAVGSMAMIPWLYQKEERHKKAPLFNAMALISTLAVGLALYQWGWTPSEATGTIRNLSHLSEGRMISSIAVFGLVYLWSMTRRWDVYSFSKIFFTAHKAFLISALYGLSAFAGTAAVAAAIQNLLYNNMPGEIYGYLGAASGFLAFTIFLGCFPPFELEETYREYLQDYQHPPFVVALLNWVLIPIIIAMTLVLFIWSGRSAITGVWPEFSKLSTVAATYGVCGLWLHILVATYVSPISKRYRSYYPIAALGILGFEAWALGVRLSISGIQTTEYFFILLWKVTAISALLLLIRKERAHGWILILTCGAMIVSVLPGLGYYDFPVAQQSVQLEQLLIQNQMLQSGKIAPAQKLPSKADRIKITETIQFLSDSKHPKLPAWFITGLSDGDLFKKKLGFEPITAHSGEITPAEPVKELFANLPQGNIPIDGYDWAIHLSDEKNMGLTEGHLETGNNSYDIQWQSSYNGELPRIIIYKNKTKVIDQSLESYFKKIVDAYPLSSEQTRKPTAQEMSTVIEASDLKVKLVFEIIQITKENSSDKLRYSAQIHTVFFKENGLK